MLKGKETTQFNADAELLFRIIHSVNQLSIYGAVSNWCEQYGLRANEKGQERFLGKGEAVNKEKIKSVISQEVNSSVSSPRQASGNRLRENIQDLESLSETIQFTNVCELASFWYLVSTGVSHKTKPDEDDGFGEPIPVCRGYTLPRATPLSRAHAEIPGETIIGPVIEVHVMQVFGTHGLAIETPSPNSPKRTSWVLISRGNSRFVDELHIPSVSRSVTSAK